MSPVNTRTSAQTMCNNGALLLGDNAIVLNGGEIIVQRQEETEEDVKKKLLLRRKTHLEIINKEGEEQRKTKRYLLLQRLAKLRMEIEKSKTEGRDALQVAPEETWTNIMDYVTDCNDVVNCSKSCRLLEKILRGRNLQCLFIKVLPLLYNELEETEILNCRKVCKLWCNGIDSILENIVSVPECPRRLETPFTGSHKSQKEKIAYLFHAPKRSHGIGRFRKEMKRHPKNPFIGRTVALQLKMKDDDSDFSIERNVEKLIKKFGKHIHHFKLFGRSGKYQEMSPSSYYHVSLEILYNCPNLRTLCLSHINTPWPYEGLPVYFSLFWHSDRKLPLHPNLESLLVYKHNKNFIPILDLFLRKFSNQLKCVEVCIWNSKLYHTLPWQNLRRLVVTANNSGSWMNSVYLVDAPNLVELGIRLDGSGPLFKKMMRLINGFPKVEKLELKFSNQFSGFSKTEILKRARVRHLVCPYSVVNLEIKLAHKSNILSYDFLTYFPHIKRLCIQISGNEDHESQHVPDDSEIVNLANYLDHNNIYNSNVWQVIPRLEFVSIYKLTDADELKESVYSRNQYDIFSKLDLSSCLNLVSRHYNNSLNKRLYLQRIENSVNQFQ